MEELPLRRCGNHQQTAAFAAAVAGGLALASLGSDTGGSVRQPAAFCGCVGFKPSYGRVSRYGLASYSSSLDQIGVLTQNVEDAAILYDAIAGYDKMDSTSAKVDFTPTAPNLNAEKKLRIAVIENYVNEASAEVKAALLKSIEMLKANGHEIVYKNMLDSKFDIAAYYIIATAEASANLSRYDGVRYGKRSQNTENLKDMYINTRSEGFGEEVKRRILLGTFVLSSGYYDAYYIKAQKARAFIKAKYEEILLKNGVKFYDATCPIVNLNLQRIKDSKDEIIFVGKNGHPETMASLAAKDNVHLYDINNEFDYSVIKSGSVFVTNQTTLSFIELENIFKDIKKHIPSAKFSDEICNASRVRQEKISSLDSKYDLVLIIGDKTSSNTTKLFDISSKNDSHATYFVSNLDEVKKTDLSKYHYCAIFSGTSCPKSLINTIKDYLEVTYGKI